LTATVWLYRSRQSVGHASISPNSPLYDLAKPEHAERFFAGFATGGELFCSRVNLIEVTRNTRLKFRRAHQLEQQKLCVEMANHVSSRRDTFSALAFSGSGKGNVGQRS
jgi:hypothetical protein